MSAEGGREGRVGESVGGREGRWQGRVGGSVGVWEGGWEGRRVGGWGEELGNIYSTVMLRVIFSVTVFSVHSSFCTCRKLKLVSSCEGRREEGGGWE